ncbi:ROK family protein [Pseudonocardia nematodicida]|uniref:ROK family protein n=1 Tax=Pseudonocardia nematodicida TaxID=1206997 RepID=A0ABV1K3Y1_9PSEU
MAPRPVTDGPARAPAVRRHNLGLLLDALRGAPSSRASLATATGLTRGTVAVLLDPLVEAGVLAEGVPTRSGVGRPGRPLWFAATGPVVLGISVEVDGIDVRVSGLDGETVLRARRRRDHRRHPAADVFARAARVARELADRVGRPVAGAGLAVPGPVRGDGDDAVLLQAPNLPLLRGCRPARLTGPFGTAPPVVGNEASLGALAHLGEGPDFVYVSADVGIGGGIVLDGRVLPGSRGVAGEIGHVVVERDGRACGCGGSGCVEQYAGLPALLGDAGVAAVPELRAAARAGDPAVLGALGRAGSALGVALASVIHVVDVPAVVLGGRYAELGDWLVPAVRAEMRRRGLTAGPEVEVLASAHGRSAAAAGAARAALDRVLAEPDLLLAR